MAQQGKRELETSRSALFRDTARQDARPRTEVPALTGGYSVQSRRVYLPISEPYVPKAVAAGAVIGPKGGVYAELPPERWKPEIEPFLPFFAREIILPILPDLIPVTSWGSSLANLLTKPSWDALRLPVIEARGNLCQVCGERQGTMECHEIWAYSLPPENTPEGTVGVQRLIGLAALCRLCHEIFHFGLAKIQGRFEIVKRRLITINRWTAEDFDTYNEAMVRRSLQRAKVHWALDVSLVEGRVPMVIKSGRDGWTLHEEGFLSSPARQSGQPGWTVILGASYLIGEREIPAIDPQEAKDGLRPEEGDFDFTRQMGDGVTSLLASA